MTTETKTYYDSSDCNADPKSTGSGSALILTPSPSRVPHPELDGTDLTLARKLPYRVGFTAIATRHEPNKPYGTDHPAVSGDWINLSQLDYCLLNPSIGGKTLPQETKTLKITAVIRASCNQGAQLVVVNDDMVAKIYDPLFYDDSDEWGYELDVVSGANSDYRREAAAYQELQKSPAARELIPTFYGTWTVNIDTLTREGDQLWKHTRQVPLILIEHVQGLTMTDIDPQVLTEPIRTSVLKKVFHIDSVIYQAGVNHRDIHPRNIIVVGVQSDMEHGASQEAIVKLIDFNIAEVRLHPQCDNIQRRIEEEMRAWCPKLPSPFLRWHRRLDEFGSRGWCPVDDFELKDKKPKLWLWKQFKDDERYIPVIWDPVCPRKSPKYVELTQKANNSSDSGVKVDECDKPTYNSNDGLGSGFKVDECDKPTRNANDGSGSDVEVDECDKPTHSAKDGSGSGSGSGVEVEVDECDKPTHDVNECSDSGVKVDVKSPEYVKPKHKANNSSASEVEADAYALRTRKSKISAGSGVKVDVKSPEYVKPKHKANKRSKSSVEETKKRKRVDKTAVMN